MIENYTQKSAEGLSQYLLYFWLAGDLANVTSCILTNQLPFQTYLATYYCMTDFVLLFQCFYYRKNKKCPEMKEYEEIVPLCSEPSKYGSTAKSHTQLLGLFIFGFQVTRSVNSDPIVDPAVIGCVLAWTCTTFYLSSRIPQIIKNYKRHSVQGLSLALFSFAVAGNVTYALSIILRPDQTREMIINSIPYVSSALGTLIFDLIIFIQFLHYGKTPKVDTYVP